MKNIVIADDSDTARMFVRRCFEIAGLAEANILEARDGNQAFGFLELGNIDLVITDLNMPGLDGRNLLKRIRTDVRFTAVPVIVVSSAANAELGAELKVLGAQAIIKKPPSPEHAARCLELLRMNNG